MHPMEEKQWDGPDRRLRPSPFPTPSRSWPSSGSSANCGPRRRDRLPCGTATNPTTSKCRPVRPKLRSTRSSSCSKSHPRSNLSRVASVTDGRNENGVSHLSATPRKLPISAVDSGKANDPLRTPPVDRTLVAEPRRRFARQRGNWTLRRNAYAGFDGAEVSEGLR